MEHMASQVKPTQKPSLTPVSRGLLTPMRRGIDFAGLTGEQRMKVRDNSTHQTKHSTVPSLIDKGLNSRNQPHDPITQSFKEPRLGHDFSRIRVNSETHEAEAVNNLNAGPLNTSALTSNQDAGVPAGAGSGAGSGSAGAGSAGAGSAGAAGGGGPGGGGAGGGGTPPHPATVTIGSVRFRGSIHRIAPTRATTVPVTVGGLAAGSSVAIDVQGSGGANGTATITAGASLTGSGTVTVRGDNQTTPGNARHLRIRARVGPTVVGRSPGFTVAAWPTNFTTSRVNDINSGGGVGVAAANAWESDGSTLSELDEAERTERVDIGSRDNPPFTSGAGTSATAGTSGFIAGTASPTTDSHSYARALIDTVASGPGIFRLVYRQNFLFNDRRTGVTNRVVRHSGFRITHIVAVVMAGPMTGRAHQTVKAGAAVTVEGRATTAGSGTATSDTHGL